MDEMTPRILKAMVQTVRNDYERSNEESILVEEPLEIRLDFSRQKQPSTQLAITMRTPGDDEDLVRGFLFSEGIIKSCSDIAKIEAIDKNVSVATISASSGYSSLKIRRNLLMSSSCGLCGKESLEGLQFESRRLAWRSRKRVLSSTICQLQTTLDKHQILFSSTGGSHCAALFSFDGELLNAKEDIGRHNALDKLIGSELQRDLRNGILVLSGRSSYELLQKAAMAGMSIVASIGAPSSMAIEVAEQEGITLIGFLKPGGFNVYSCPERIKSNRVDYNS